MQDTEFASGEPDEALGPSSTGNERVDLAMQRLAGLDDLPLAAQVTVFDDVHRLLQDALTGAEPASSETSQR